MSNLVVAGSTELTMIDEEQLVTMMVDGQLFGIPILKVQDIVEPSQITPVPCAPSAIAGVLNLRGRIVTVIDLREDTPEAPWAAVADTAGRGGADLTWERGLGGEPRWRTDRLGMPLIETVTDPDMVTPWEVAEVGQIIRWLARVSGLVRTGSGAGRQDVNVSVAGGPCNEIKGVPNHRILPRLVHNEGFRQLNLLRIREELRRRGVESSTFEAATGRPVSACSRIL